MVGEKLGSFRIESVLGSGAMGVVYKAVNEITAKVAAVKVIHGEVGQKGKGYERFRREAEILQQFRHPNIVRFLALGKYKGTSYFAMEFVQGMTLEQLLKEKETLPWKEVAALGIQICEALQYAHDHGVVHRDLKPSNLMVAETGKVKLTDFGIAKDLDATALTATGRTLGTAAYMAPEQIKGTPEISHKTDLYALGIVFYQMLTGLLPFEGASAMMMMHGHVNLPAPRASSKLAEIPKALDDLVYQLMAKDPQDRPWDAGAVAEKLKGVLEKAEKGEKVKMVWPGPSEGGSPTTINSVEDVGVSKSTARKRKAARARASEPRDSESGTLRHRLETLGLVALLLLIGGLIVYFSMPLGQEALYAKAKTLMASDKRHDWVTAHEDYIEPLKKRFPQNPYAQEISAWRDKVLLADAVGRAGPLSSSITQLNKPQTEAERKFVVYNADVAAALKDHDEVRALKLYDEFAKSLKRDDDGEERSWYLYATGEAAKIREDIATRKKLINDLWLRATAAAKEGKHASAKGIYDDAVEKYAVYTDGREELMALGPVPGLPPHPKLVKAAGGEPAPLPAEPPDR